MTLIQKTLASLECADKLFPVYAGNMSNQTVNCFEFDESTGMVIVGGNATSDSLGTSAYGFVYAIDLDGNWIWNVAL